MTCTRCPERIFYLVTFLFCFLQRVTLVKGLSTFTTQGVARFSKPVSEIYCDNPLADDKDYRIHLLKLEALPKIEPEDNQIVKPPLLFIHGSFHSAWCWKQYMSFFSEQGFPCYAISLRGTAATGLPKGSKGKSKVLIEDHVSDVTAVLKQIKECHSFTSPVIVSHSFGGLLTMKLLENENVRPLISSAALLCSVPPSGNGPMTTRFLKSRLLLSLKIIYGFVFKGLCKNLGICRELLFDNDSITDAELQQYMRKFEEDSRVTIDLFALKNALPSIQTDPNRGGVAKWLLETESLESQRRKPFLVVGARNDALVDAEGVKETADFFGVDPVFIDDLYHDVMLGRKYHLTAAVLSSFLTNLGQANIK